MAIASLFISAYHQVLAGAQQKELQVSGMQLLHECTPPAAVAMALLVPLIDPIGLSRPGPGTLLRYRLTAEAAAVIGCSALLGFAVMLSAFGMIGATSALTYNILGYSKTIFIVLGGCAGPLARWRARLRSCPPLPPPGLLLDWGAATRRPGGCRRCTAGRPAPSPPLPPRLAGTCCSTSTCRAQRRRGWRWR